MRNILGAVSVLGLLAGPAGAGDRWDMPTPYADNNFHTVNIKQFADDVAQATDGALEIVVHSAASLFKLPEIKRAVQTGQVPIGEVLMSALGNEDPLYEVDSVPFLAADYDAARKLWTASRPMIEARLDRQGMMVLFAVPWPPQALFAKTPLTAIADLEGVRFRVYNAMTGRLAELMGALPTTVQMPELPQAFSTGMVSAMITSPSFAVDTQAWDFVDHMYQTRAMVPKDMVIMHRRAFQRLDGAVQAALLAAAESAEERGWRMSAEETAAKTQVLADNGMNVAEPAEAFMAELQAIGQTMIAEWVESAGPDGAAVIAAYRDR
ncbi:MAG: TRAP transporter substrate-binding protein [Alphaproteobacteria bacterium]|jgi:TRAP-type C4-dicarboxylate transport system substrate-binding protein|nr:TRAP transporter substrate-binding protein [Alphaproteobacteria bacterium]MDP6515333.1 TRAP transporter substrate-binding protein [Alphaproteobacteria bacterium]